MRRSVEDKEHFNQWIKTFIGLGFLLLVIFEVSSKLEIKIPPIREDKVS